MFQTGEKLVYKMRAIFLLLMCTMPYAAYSDINPDLPDLGEPYVQDISYGDIRSAFANGNYELGLYLSLELLYTKARQQFVDEKKFAVNMVWLAKKLQDILNDSNKTNEEKGEEIARVIAATLEPYEFRVSGGLNTSLMHSIEYGATFIAWDDKTEYDNCSGWYVSLKYVYECDSYGFCDYVPYYNYTWINEYLAQVPDYYIYRVVNGQDKLITKIRGYKQITSNNVGISPSDGWGKLVFKAYNYFKSVPEASVGDGRLFWIDLHSDIRRPGETLSYKIVADNKPYKAGKCGHSNTWVSTINADSDGNGKMDFIPEHEYGKFFGKYYGWLIPVVTLLN